MHLEPHNVMQHSSLIVVFLFFPSANMGVQSVQEEAGASREDGAVVPRGDGEAGPTGRGHGFGYLLDQG